MNQNYKEIYDWHIHNQNDLTLVTTLINYQIMDIIKRHNSAFAFPSRSVYLEKTQDDKI